MSLLRFPGNACPPEALTGDPVLDRYLADLDARLLGGAKVRALTLAEIKDELLERKALELKAAPGGAEAARIAVERTGPTEPLAQAQRAELRSRFRNVALTAGLPFGLLMGGFSAANATMSWPAVAFTTVFDTLFFGLALGWWAAYVYPQRRLPEASADGGGEYVVEYSRPMRALGGVFAVFFAALAFALLFGWTIPALDALLRQLPLPRWALTAAGLFSAFDLIMVRLTLRRYRVDRDGFSVEGLTTERVPWTSVRAVGALGERSPWLPEYWRRTKFVEYVSAEGAPRRILLYGDMFNADRLLVSIRERLGAVGPAC